jgi:cobalamin-dependent methionine synthase I
MAIDSVGLEEGTTFRSRKLAQVLKDSEEIICFVATLGRRLDREIGCLMAEKRLSEAYVLDAMGSVAVEGMVEHFYQRKQIEFAAENKSVTLRFSPGYCDWPVTDQKQLFSLFGSEQAGVELLDSCLMTPRKSISGVFGLFYSTNTHLDSPYNPCRDCRKIDCMARRS